MGSLDKDLDVSTVLVVDDVESNRIILGEIIKNMGCVPVLADSGETAATMLEQCNPQLILTDISMPGMDGYELCRIVKSSEETKDIPVVFISAFDDPKDIVEGFSIGGGDYITKPFIPEVVQSRVGVHLHLYEANRKLTEMNRRLQISVREQLKQMEKEKKDILYAMANIAARNANYDEKHMKRLKRNCRILAQGMQFSPLFEDKLSDTFIDTIEMASTLCDIGYIGIPVEIVKKDRDGMLSDEDLDKMHEHTEIGAKLLEDLYVGSDYNDFITTTIDIIKYHHERWDGTGYPNKLSGDSIPLSAQIVSIMERYTVLTEKAGCDREAALRIMEEQSGAEFNPEIFEICKKISRQLS